MGSDLPVAPLHGPSVPPTLDNVGLGSWLSLLSSLEDSGTLVTGQLARTKARHTLGEAALAKEASFQSNVAHASGE